MQNMFIQIAIGLSPIALFFLVSGIVAKKHKVRNIVSAVIFIAAIGVMVVPQFSAQHQLNDAVKSYDKLGLIYSVADEGSIQLAQTLLQDQREEFYNSEYALAAARLSVQSGDYAVAQSLYQKALVAFPEVSNEVSSLAALCEAEAEFYSVTMDSDISGIYKTRATLISVIQKDISKAIKNTIPETEENVYNKLARFVVFADEMHKNYLNGESLDIPETQKQLKRMENFLEENSQFLSTAQVRLARLKLQLLCGDYKSIATSVSGESDYSELLIVSELYLNNYVKQGDFSGEFSKENTEKYQTVYEKLNEIYDHSYKDKSREQRNKAKSQLDALKTMIKNPALGKMEEGLSQYATRDYAIDASKAYLQMAKIQHSLGNETKSGQYIDRSIDTVGDCEDGNYTAPMYELVGIITNKGEPERLKEMSEYVEKVLDNNMTVKVKNLSSTLEADDSDEKSLTGDFSSQLQIYVSQKRMSVNIVNVDTTEFEKNSTVKAPVNISNNLYTTAEELKKAMSVVDCGTNITDFTVEKVNYSGANILLCVDISGSMQGSKIENLKDAIKYFVADKADIENIALVTFNSSVNDDYPFGMSVGELIDAADSINAGGGTAVYHSLTYSIEKFTKNSGEINSVILMTDGQDGYSASIDEIEEYVGKPCKEKGITVYTIGFGGDADGAYLNSIAAATGGKYLYASDPTSSSQVNQLEEFFGSLRAQILNQYTITFKAIDTLTHSRELKVSVGDRFDSDRVTYYLGGGTDSITDPDNHEDSLVSLANKTIHGFEPRFLFKNGKTLNVTLKGEGLKADDTISVTLKGNTYGIEWDLATTYIDSNTVKVSIPSGIGVDVYDAYVNVNGKIAYLQKGISIFKQGSEKVTDFGQYRFISYNKEEQNDSIRLSGYVTMNGWLHFNDDVTLTGDLKSDSISLLDLGGSYVSYSKENSQGLANALAKVGVPVYMPSLGIITLHNNSAHEKQFSDFKVEAFPLNSLDLGKYFLMTDTQVKLHPNRATFEAENITATLPYANKILKTKMGLFTFNYGFGGSISSNNIGVSIDLSYSPSNSIKDEFFPLNFGNAPIYVAPKGTKVRIDTLANDYEFKFQVRTAFIAGQKALGLSAKWDNPDSGENIEKHSNGLVPTEIKLYSDFKISANLAGVPITYSDFMLGIEDIDTSKNPIYWTLVGGCNISAAKISAVPGMSGLKDWIGDVSVLTLDNAKLSFNLGESYVKAETKLKLFGELNCGKVLVELGKFSYTSALLNMSDEPVSGLRFVGTLGPNWKFGESSLKLQLTGEFDGLSKFVGIQGKGEFDAKLKVWIISIGKSANGEVAVGMRITSDGSTAFVVRTNPSLPKGGLTWPKNMAGKV